VIVPCNTALLIDFVPMYSGIDEQPIKKNKIGNVLFITLEAGKKYKITSTSSITTSTVSFYLFDVTGEKEK
jgi:hypothetical protein